MVIVALQLVVSIAQELFYFFLNGGEALKRSSSLQTLPPLTSRGQGRAAVFSPKLHLTCVGSEERRSSLPWWNSHLAEGDWAAVGLPQRLASFTAHAH